MLPSKAVMYRALLERDQSFEGIFFAGVKTTGIFCRPACRARKPKLQNVEFFTTATEALQTGYQPCQLCRPMAPAGETPEKIAGLLARVQADPMGRIRDADVRSAGLEPSAVRRWFRKHHGMTFQAYQRSLRLGRACGRIVQGQHVAEAAFDQGYESLSGFGDAFKKTYGRPPTDVRSGRLIRTVRIPTPLGVMLAGAVDQGVCLLEFADRRMLERELEQLKKLLGAEISPGVCGHFDLLQRELGQYFEGKLKRFTVPLCAPGTPFQLKAWQALRRIPYGSTRTYRQQAEAMGTPKAVRAVGRANGSNRISILIPCHRVIGDDGKLVGYGGGLWRKQRLLELESKNKGERA